MTIIDTPCIGCGLCCDGTIVTHLAVRDESDLGMPLRGLGVELIVISDPPVFELPCPALDAGRCSIFELHRPHACAQFECAISSAVASGTLAMTDARRIIAETIELRDGVRSGGVERAELDAQIDRHFRT